MGQKVPQPPPRQPERPSPGPQQNSVSRPTTSGNRPAPPPPPPPPPRRRND